MKNWIICTTILAVAATITVPLASRVRSLTVDEQFERIQIGMSVEDVDWIMEPWNLVDCTLVDLLGKDYTGELGYGCDIILNFDQGRVTQKSRGRAPRCEEKRSSAA